MTRTDFERFKEEKEAALAECLRGRLGEEDGPDIPAVDSADSLKEQYYWFRCGAIVIIEKSWTTHPTDVGNHAPKGALLQFQIAGPEINVTFLYNVYP